MICPNCGREVTGRFCTGCGAKLAAASAPPQTSAPANSPNPGGAPRYASNPGAYSGYAPNQGYQQGNPQGYQQSNNQGYQQQGYGQNQPYNSGFAYNRNFNPGYVPNQGFNPGPQVNGGYRDLPPEMAAQSPGAQVLRRVAGSPLILISAILVTLFAGVICYYCGKEILDVLDYIDSLFDFDGTKMKIGVIVDLAGNAVQILLAVWMMIALWSLFGSAAENKPVMSRGGLSVCRTYASASLGIFVILGLAAVISLFFLVIDKKSDSDFYYTAKTLAVSGITHIGALFAPSILNDAVLQWVSVCVVFLVAAIQSSLLFAVFASSGRMLRFGGPLQKRVAPAGLLTLLAGLVLLGGNVYMLVEYGERADTEEILFYSAFLALGLASILCSIALFMDSARMKALLRQG